MGAALGGGRWNSVGSPVVYLAETPAGAMLEVLAHLPLNEGDLPEFYRLLRVEATRAIDISSIDPPVHELWQHDESSTRQLGDAWLASGQSALARVPSVIMPHTWNYLLNPQHLDASAIRINGATDHVYDPRLLRVRGFER